MQSAFLRELCEMCKREEINVAIDTSGYAPWKQIEDIAPYVDVFLYDVKKMCIRDSHNSGLKTTERHPVDSSQTFLQMRMLALRFPESQDRRQNMVHIRLDAYRT